MTFLTAHLTPILELVTALLSFLSTISASKDKKEAIRTNTYSVNNSHINSVNTSGVINVQQNIDNSNNAKESRDRWEQQSDQLDTIYILVSVILLLLCLLGSLYEPSTSTFSISTIAVYNALRTYILLLATINLFNLFLFFKYKVFFSINKNDSTVVNIIHKFSRLIWPVSISCGLINIGYLYIGSITINYITLIILIFYCIAAFVQSKNFYEITVTNSIFKTMYVKNILWHLYYWSFTIAPTIYIIYTVIFSK